MQTCSLCNSKAEFYEDCPFRLYLRFYLCFMHYREEMNYHEHNKTRFLAFQILPYLKSKKGVKER